LCTEAVTNSFVTRGAKRSVAEHPPEKVGILTLQAFDLVRHVPGEIQFKGYGAARGPIRSR